MERTIPNVPQNERMKLHEGCNKNSKKKRGLLKTIILLIIRHDRWKSNPKNFDMYYTIKQYININSPKIN